MAESLTVQLDKIMDAYMDHFDHAAEIAFDRVARESVKRLRNTSPKKTGSYARGWGLKRMSVKGGSRIATIVVHNRTDYQLTHLLENGHIIRNKYGEYGRTNGDHHIKDVEEWANNELPNEIKRELE